MGSNSSVFDAATSLNILLANVYVDKGYNNILVIVTIIRVLDNFCFSEW